MTDIEVMITRNILDGKPHWVCVVNTREGLGEGGWRKKKENMEGEVHDIIYLINYDQKKKNPKAYEIITTILFFFF